MQIFLGIIDRSKRSLWTPFDDLILDNSLIGTTKTEDYFSLYATPTSTEMNGDIHHTYEYRYHNGNDVTLTAVKKYQGSGFMHTEKQVLRVRLTQTMRRILYEILGVTLVRQ